MEAAIACLPATQASAVTVTCDAALPSVWGDHDRLEQVLLNLLSNAFRHNPAGTRVRVCAGELPGAPTSSPDVTPTEAQVELTVTDAGPGFPEVLARSPFESTRRHRSASSGAGLGLSIARGIVEAHRGRIELAWVPIGTAFRIVLPVEAPGAQGTGSELLEDAEDHLTATAGVISLGPRTIPTAGADG